MERILRGVLRFSWGGFTYLRIASRLYASAPSETSAQTGRRTSLPRLFCLLAMCLPKNLVYAIRGSSARSQRSEEHTSELQSHLNLVCRLLLEKKKHTISTC